MKLRISQEQLERIRRDIVEAFTPKETPVSKHPETTTEWLEDIALELHAITALLNERLPVVRPGGQSNELNNDDPEGLLQAARADRDTWEAAYKRADDAYSRARDERDTALTNQQASDAALTEVLDEVHRWRDRYEALREDVEALRDGYRDRSVGDLIRIYPHDVARRVDWYVLIRDDERGQS